MKQLFSFLACAALSNLALFGQTLTVTAPNTGGTLYLDNPYTIRWTSSGVTGSVRLVLFQANTKLGAIASGLEVSAGRFAWTVGRLADGTKAPEGGDYRVRIVSGAGEEGTSDFSDTPFTIAALRAQPRASVSPPPVPPGIRVERPALGDDVTIGEPKARITWISPDGDSGVNIGDTVSLTLVRRSDGRETTIDTRVRNGHGSRTYYWTVKPSLFGEPGDYRVRVLSSSGLVAESGTFRLVRENDFVAEIIPGTFDMTFRGHTLGGHGPQGNMFHYEVRARFRNGGISQNGEVPGVGIMGALYYQNGAGEWVRIDHAEKRITVPAWGHGWITVTFEDEYDVIVPDDQTRPLKYVVTIDSPNEFPDANRDNNTSTIQFLMK